MIILNLEMWLDELTGAILSLLITIKNNDQEQS